MPVIINSTISPRYGTYGRNQTLVQTVSETIPMSSMTTWVSSTSTTNMRAAANKFTTSALNLANNSYVLEIKNWTQFYYNSGTTAAKGIAISQAQVLLFVIEYTYRGSDLFTRTSGNYYYGSVRTLCYSPSLNSAYYSSASAYTYQTNNSYSIYMSATAPTLSSTTSTTPTLTVKTPQLNGRCHDSYFSTSAASATDKTNTKWNITYNLYSVDKYDNISHYLITDNLLETMRTHYDSSLIHS